MSDSAKPTQYDQIQNRWIWSAAAIWMVSIIVAIATTADVVGNVVRKELNELRERVVQLEHENSR